MLIDTTFGVVAYVDGNMSMSDVKLPRENDSRVSFVDSLMNGGKSHKDAVTVLQSIDSFSKGEWEKWASFRSASL